MIKTVFLDMDGVLVNFRKGVHDAFNKPYDYSTLSKKWTFWNDWPEVTLEMVNSACNLLFWTNLEWTEGGRDILRTIWQIFDSKDIYLLTDPVIGHETETGKMAWVNAWLPEYVKRTIITQAPKHLVAKPNTLLIDDKDENVEEFVKAGGYGILVNRPWNKGYERADHTVEDLEIDLLDIVHDIGIE